MQLSKEEFSVLVMLYVANIDGHVNPDEIRLMLEKSTSKVYVDVKKQFSKMSDIEVLQCIEENKSKYFSDEENRQRLMDDLKSLIEADEKLQPVEEYILHALSRIL